MACLFARTDRQFAPASPNEAAAQKQDFSIRFVWESSQQSLGWQRHCKTLPGSDEALQTRMMPIQSGRFLFFSVASFGCRLERTDRGREA